jgi:hypothetical protein
MTEELEKIVQAKRDALTEKLCANQERDRLRLEKQKNKQIKAHEKYLEKKVKLNLGE